ncbi:MAG: ESPR-type extended signal peptide-containing protein, partial [Pasteurella oralis]|uniref:ESPR domain-containing protein n=1 Tax=Pasteurella oralis TaxID=1071947 RepID=UPI00270A38FC|nr:ESPR-type extended signal peptide-containing protein [Pasteurella oralis]
MNHIYRIVWNHSTACWQAVSEIGKGKHKVKASKERSGNALQKIGTIRPLAVLVSLFASSIAVAAPTGGQVTVGQAQISQQGAVTNIHQSSQNAAINWQQFNIKPQETV